jgi:hypothetical protein
MRVRASEKGQLVVQLQKATKEKRTTESKARKEKRKAKGKAEDLARVIKRSPAAKKAAETLQTKRGIAGKKEQANYQKTKARVSTRMGGRRKQIQGELHDRPAE